MWRSFFIMQYNDQFIFSGNNSFSLAANSSPLVIDTVTVQNSKFEIKNYSSDGIYRLRFGDNQNNSIFLYIEKNDKIKIDADLNNLNTYKVEGSKGSSEILRLSTAAKTRFAELDSARNHYKNAQT